MHIPIPWRSLALSVGIALLLGSAAAQQQPADPRATNEARRQGPAHVMSPLDLSPGIDVVAGRPTERSVRLVALAHAGDELAQLRWWPASGGPAGAQARPLRLTHLEPLALQLDGLSPDTDYRYELRRGERADGAVLADGRFRTWRPAGSSFTVTLTADSHLDQNTDVPMLRKTLALARADAPDFHIDLGDTFMVDKHADRAGAAAQYLAQRQLFGQLGVPLYLVLGNHDGEERKLLREGPQSLAVWANQQRKRYFANPEPDQLYTGNETPDPWAGPLQDYYAWTWGDAQFIVLNPYWHAPAGRAPERWGLSVGRTQYEWLRRVLAGAAPRYRFVFIHQLVGGIDRQGRGGAEAVPYGEWGGNHADGSPGFETQRPGWAEPIHDLLKRAGVTAVFHGHDHLYAWQERDGIAYVETPQPGHRGPGHGQAGQDYGYRSGVVRGEGGYLRLRVGPNRCDVEFIATDGPQATVLHRAELRPRAVP